MSSLISIKVKDRRYRVNADKDVRRERNNKKEGGRGSTLITNKRRR